MLKSSYAFSGFSVSDMEAAVKFYGETLGLDTENGSTGLKINLPGGGHVFLYPKADHIPATFTILNFQVNNIDEAVADLKAKGVTFEIYGGTHQGEDGIARGIATKMGPDIAWFKDPAGNILSVLQEA